MTASMPPASPAAPMPYGAPLSLEAAKRIMAAAESEAEAQGWPMVIAIADSTGHLVMLHRMANAQLASVAIATAKAQTAVNFRRNTKVFQDLVALGGVHHRLLAMPGMTPLEGGVPVVVDGCVAGAVGVSGMASGQDAQVAEAGIRALLDA